MLRYCQKILGCKLKSIALLMLLVTAIGLLLSAMTNNTNHLDIETAVSKILVTHIQQQRKSKPEKLITQESVSLSKIPRIIHFTSKTEKVESFYKEFLQKWKQQYPEFQFYLWRDSDAVCLMQQHYPNLLLSYKKLLQTPLERGDIARIMAIYHYGGLYIDFDVNPIRDIRHLFNNASAGLLLAQEPIEHSVFLFKLPSLVSNAAMLSVPKHPFFLFYLDCVFQYLELLHRGKGGPAYLIKRSNYGASHVTGPLMLHKSLDEYRKQNKCRQDSFNCSVSLLQPEVFSPNYDLDQRKNIQSQCRQGSIFRNSLVGAKASDLCKNLAKRNFYHPAKISNLTVAIHEFRHITANMKEKDRIKSLFNITDIIPNIQFYRNSTNKTSC